jgi:hypothetical protein
LLGFAIPSISTQIEEEDKMTPPHTAVRVNPSFFEAVAGDLPFGSHDEVRE